MLNSHLELTLTLYVTRRLSVCLSVCHDVKVLHGVSDDTRATDCQGDSRRVRRHDEQDLLLVLQGLPDETH